MLLLEQLVVTDQFCMLLPVYLFIHFLLAAMCRLALCTQMSQYRRDAVDDHMRVALGVAETCTKNQRAKS